MITHMMEQGSEAWYAIRCGKVTGTRFKALTMSESTKGYQDLVADIVCEMITGKKEDTYSNAIMEKGIETEPIAREMYRSIFEVEVKTVGFITPDEDHKYAEWIGISPDGIMPDIKGMIEIKCPLMKTHLRYIECNYLPTDYRHQVQGQLFVTGFDYCDFMSYSEGMKPFIFRAYPDKILFKEFEDRLDILINHVKEKLNRYNKYDYYE